LKVLLDTSVLSDKLLPTVSGYLAGRAVAGDTFHISVITHFEIM
jgi:predicted nucleic acid-binding protein